VLYAHIYLYNDKHHVLYHNYFKFENKIEEEFLEDKLVVTLSEPSGDQALLDEQIENWLQCHDACEIVEFWNMQGVSNLSTEEHIESLQKEAYIMSDLLEQERKKNLHLQARLKAVSDYWMEQAKSKEALQDMVTEEIAMLQNVIHIAEDDGCMHIAAVKKTLEPRVLQ
jgi:hypothetical protein